jgi:hypothetical protein
MNDFERTKPWANSKRPIALYLSTQNFEIEFRPLPFPCRYIEFMNWTLDGYNTTDIIY